MSMLPYFGVICASCAFENSPHHCVICWLCERWRCDVLKRKVILRSPSQANARDDDDDRKRLKERLKGAVNSDRRRHKAKAWRAAEDWLEYVFGICRADHRLGKLGSRCVDGIAPLC